MKKRSKALLLTLCAVVLVAASVFGTVAYFTDSDADVNTFTVGQVGIKLDEAPVDENGQKKTGDRVQENSYQLIPGYTYDKDPTIQVDAKSEECWLFVKVDNGLAGIETKEAGKTIAEQMAAKGWIEIDAENSIYGRASTNKAGDQVVVFETFTIDGKSVDKTDIAAKKDAKISITAYAVQAAGFDTAEAAWNTAKSQINP